MQPPAGSGLGWLRLGGAVCLAAVLLRLWHMVLLRQYLDAPGLVAMWIAAATALAIFVRLGHRSLGEGGRPKRGELALIGLSAVLLFLFHWGFERAASDGREYFAQVRSLVMDRDLDFSNETAVLGGRGAAKMYPIGAAILWAPFMVLAHLWLSLLNLLGGAHSVDGYTNPYQRAIGLGTLVYGCTGLLLAWRILRDYFDEAVSIMAIVGIAAGTFFLWYVTIENSMVHSLSMFAVTLFLYVWHRGRPGRHGSAAIPASAWWIALGATAGVMTMVRWQNITWAALAGLVTLWTLRRAGWPAIRGFLVCAAAGVCAFLPQLVFWQAVRGSWYSVPAADHGFTLRSLHIADVLFSPNHGLLSTTPLIYIAILGLPLLFRRDLALAVVLVGGFICQVIINSGSGDWWGGPGFGARRFDSSLLVFSAGLAALFVWLRKRPLAAPVAAVLILVCANVTLMVDVRNRTLRSSEAITLTDVSNTVYSRVGNPFSFPYNAYVAWRYDADWSMYDRLKGRTYSNIDVDFGDTGDDMFLGHGWSGPERGDPLTYRWASSTVASLVVPLRAPANYQLELVCSPFEYPGSPRQTIDVMINRTQIARIVMQPGLAKYQVDLPEGAWRSNLNLVQFVFGYAASPAEMKVSADPRTLSVMFDSLRLRQRTGGTP